MQEGFIVIFFLYSSFLLTAKKRSTAELCMSHLLRLPYLPNTSTNTFVHTVVIMFQYAENDVQDHLGISCHLLLVVVEGLIKKPRCETNSRMLRDSYNNNQVWSYFKGAGV